jgi:hypothetical protein
MIEDPKARVLSVTKRTPNGIMERRIFNEPGVSKNAAKTFAR